MKSSGDEFISMVALGMAYRKAKADLFYSPRSCAQALTSFESKLRTNLNALKKKLAAGRAPDVSEDAWTLVPKGFQNEPPESRLISSDPQHLWETWCEDQRKNSKKVTAEFRLMEKLPISFHVLAALWINKVGHKFEEKLSESARGNRLRRSRTEKINLLSLGSTVYYLHAYCKWRDDAFDVMEKNLAEKKSVVALTADVRSFYHKLDVRFMLNNEFIARIGVNLTENEQFLHNLFINALHQWAGNTPLKIGLPVGLVASSVIANVALFELDQLFEREVAPLYYGRYVDDIILVMENRAGFKSSIDVWNWLSNRLKDPSIFIRNNNEVQYKQEYLKGSKIIFAGNKNKTFLLSGESGDSVLQSIRHEVHARTSEWRALPDLPGIGTKLESMLLTAIQRDGVSADSLRKADKVSVRRAGFALKLRDIEAYSRALQPNAWKTQRHAFFRAFTRHVLVLPTFFDFFTYLSRVLKLAVNCSDFMHLREMLDALMKIIEQLGDCDLKIKAQEGEVERGVLLYLENNLKTIISDAVESAFPLRLTRESKALWDKHFKDTHNLYPLKPIAEIQSRHKDFLIRDLAFHPLKQCLLPTELSGTMRPLLARKEIGNMEVKRFQRILTDSTYEGSRIVARLAKVFGEKDMPSGLIFPTRPMGIRDLYILHPEPFTEDGSNEISACLLALRGFKPEKGALPVVSSKKRNSSIFIRYKDNVRKSATIAVTSWNTDINSWTAAVSKRPDPDHTRLERINNLLNSVIRSRNTPDYLILPELSIPAHWFLAIAAKLQKIGISLICGIEYLHGSRKRVHNQTWAAFSYDAFGFPSTIIYRQDKQRPALHEELELRRVGGKVLMPQLKAWSCPPIVNHGGFCFAVLVCSELTNISYRTALRGKVDALFVPEWNQDTESFNALVESAALDIHAYIVQCNHRQHGDSRIRSPHKDNWKRDIIRVKGGIDDYFVTGKINIEALRAFQSNFRSPDRPFKPVPDGFLDSMDHNRKVLPSGASE